MSIPNYEGETCVAFLDICGFKSKMRQGLASAAEFLDKFYTIMYTVTRDFNAQLDMGSIRVRSLVVSDCAVIFVDNNGLPRNMQRDLQVILRFIKRINCSLIIGKPRLPIMTTCSIDYGKFKYEDRIGFADTRKTYFLGEPYIKAFLDNENLRKQPAKCRVLIGNSDLERESSSTEVFEQGDPDIILEMPRKHRYFYWMLNNSVAINDFKKEYSMAYRVKGQTRFAEIIRVLRHYITQADDDDRQI